MVRKSRYNVRGTLGNTAHSFRLSMLKKVAEAAGHSDEGIPATNGEHVGTSGKSPQRQDTVSWTQAQQHGVGTATAQPQGTEDDEFGHLQQGVK